MRFSFRRAVLAVAVVLAACSDGTGPRADATGQWLLRLKVTRLGSLDAGCTLSSVVRLQQSGATVTGRVPYANPYCGGIVDLTAVFDTTSTVAGTAAGDSLHLVLHGNGADLPLELRMMGDTLAGQIAGGSAGIVGARRYADSVPLGQATVRASGAFTWSGTVPARPTGNRVPLASRTDGVVFDPRTPATTLSPGTYAVGPGAAPYTGSYAHWNGVSMYDPYVVFSGGTLTVTSNDGQLARGSYDAWGRNGGTNDSIRVQGEFTGILQRYPNTF